jgi:hypothetical protein
MFIGDKKSKIYHKKGCSRIAHIQKGNKILFKKAEDVLAEFKPCQECQPPESPLCFRPDSTSYTRFGTRYTPDEWQAFYERNPDFPATDSVLLEVEREAEILKVTLDGAWKRMKKE